MSWNIWNLKCNFSGKKHKNISVFDKKSSYRSLWAEIVSKNYHFFVFFYVVTKSLLKISWNLISSSRKYFSAMKYSKKLCGLSMGTNLFKWGCIIVKFRFFPSFTVLNCFYAKISHKKIFKKIHIRGEMSVSRSILNT